ncbi:MAG: CBS domain-containing protein, partial [Methanoculleus sp.]
MKAAASLMVKIPVLRYNDHITKARSVLRDDVFRELYVVDDRGRLMGYLDISDVLRVVDTRSNITIKGFVRDAAQVAPDTSLIEVARAIIDTYTNSAAIVDEGGTLQG